MLYDIGAHVKNFQKFKFRNFVFYYFIKFQIDKVWQQLDLSDVPKCDTDMSNNLYHALALLEFLKKQLGHKIPGMDEVWYG